LDQNRKQTKQTKQTNKKSPNLSTVANHQGFLISLPSKMKTAKPGILNTKML